MASSETPSSRGMGQSIDNPGDGPIYQPAPGELQLTVRAVVIGCLLGGLVAAMNIRFGLKTGWSIGGALISAILAYSIFSILGDKERPFTPLETNIAQTAGSAAGSMTSAAGLLSSIPAMEMLGFKLGYLELTLWAGALAWLGVFYAVPLRRQMVLVDKLRFPTGTATAETINAMFSSGEEAVKKAKYLLIFAVIAAAHTILAEWVPSAAFPALHEHLPVALLTVPAAYGFVVYLSPMMAGAGILIGPRTASSLLLGAVLGWGVLAPFVESQGWVEDPTATMSYTSGARGWLLWVGVALMVADALTSLATSGGTIMRTFTGGGGADDDILEDPDEAIPNAWWMGGLVFSTVLTVLAAYWLAGIPPWVTVLAVAMSSVLAAIAVRSTGETDINPTGGVGKVTQLVFGGISPGDIQANLMTAGITSAGAAQAADMMQDLKTGHLLGASPRKQLVAQLIGAMVGVVVCVPIYVAFSNNYELGSDEYPAPAAMAWKGMAEVLTKGLDALPDNALPAVAVAVALGIALPLLKKWTSSPYVPSGLAMGVAAIVPPFYSMAMFGGALVLMVWSRRNEASAKVLAFPIASGLLVGEGLSGVGVVIGTEVMRLLGLSG